VKLTDAAKRDMKASFVVALLIESCIALLFFFNVGALALWRFHFVPILSLGFLQLATDGAVRPSEPVFYAIVFTTRVLLLSAAGFGLLRIWRKTQPA
jgi:hypothetical protein